MLQLVVVEDEENIRDCLVNLFPWSDIDVFPCASFSNGRDALEYILSNTVDILITDIKLPIMNGIELAQELSTRKNQVNIIFLTAYRDFEYAQQAVKFGVKDFLLKPVKYNELLLSILKIKETLLTNQTESIITNTSYYDQIITNIKKYVETHIKAVTLDNTAVAVNLSSGYLSRLFKEKTGQNFSEYVTYLKMKKAAEYLRNCNYKTYEVADMIGYDNPKNFTRVFKQYYQVTPREFRNEK